MDSVARFFSRIIHWIERSGTSSMKEYNDLKQIDEHWDEKFNIYLTINIKILEKDWLKYDIYVNNITRYNVF